MSTHRAATRFAPALALGLLLAAGGCAGHGKYTAEGKSRAEERLSLIKSATEWDMSRQAFMAGDLKKALRKVDMSISINDSVPKAHLLRARILIETGALEDALGSLARAEELEPENHEIQYYSGIVFERFLRREDALVRYLRAAELDDTNAQYVVAAAEMLIDLGRVDEAHDYLDGLTGSFEHNAAVRQTLGHLAMMNGEPDRAYELFREARLLSPDDVVILEDLVRSQIATLRYAEAEYNLNRLLASKDYAERRDLLHVRARCLLEIDRPVDARTVLQKLTAGQEGSADVRAWVELANVSYVLRDMSKLRQCALRIIAIAPQRHEGYMLRALWQRAHGMSEAALSSLDEAVKRRGEDTTPLIMRALVLDDLGRDVEASAALAMVHAERPDDLTVDRMIRARQHAAVATD